MKRKLLLLSLLTLAASFAYQQNQAQADVSDPESFTVTIPTAVQVTLQAVDNTFNSIVSSDFGQASNIQANNANIVGDGIVASSTSYIATNDLTNAPNLQFRITAAGTGGDTAVIADNAGVATLTVSDGGATPSVGIIMRRNGGADSDEPRLGDPAGTPVSFAVNAGALNIPASSSVPFDATTNRAPLDMVLDLDESTLSFTDDPPGTITFDLTLTVVGVN